MRLKTRLLTLAAIAIGAPAAASVAPLAALPAIVAVAPASAANCTSTISPIWFPGGDYAFAHTLSNCTDVSAVEFKRVACCTQYTTGFYNASEGTIYSAPNPPNPDVYGLYYVASSYQFVWYRHRICAVSGVVRVAYGNSSFRLKRTATQTWGSWYISWGSYQDIYCYA